MNTHDFISLIEQPDSLGKGNITALKDIAADFPYFQSAHILLTKALYNEKHYEFEKQLAYTSIQVPDRTVLFQYIHNLAAAQLEPVIIRESIIDKAITELTAVEQPTEMVSTESPVEPTEILTEVQDTTVDIQEPETLTETIEETSIEPQQTEETEPEESITPAASETHSFTEWLALQQKLKTDYVAPAQTITPEPIPEPEPQETEPVIANNTEAPKPEITIQEEIAQQVERSNINEFESVLDKFIRENPRISRGKAEFYNPVNMAKQSVEDDEEWVTETLANVYYKQGNYKKAIRAYEKLCLIYPHKYTYFANLIQKIKTENKD